VTESNNPALRLLRDLHSPLALSIVDHLRSTTDPLTSNLVAIRLGLADLAAYVRSRDGVSEGSQDREGLNRDIVAVRVDMAEAARLTRQTNQSMAVHFQSLKQTLERVLEVNRQIVDLSERINILSINASIEAARAGEAGRGFKVIASHVKTLARETTEFLDQVESSLQGAQSLFSVVDHDLHSRGAAVEEFLAKQEGSFISLQGQYIDQGARLAELRQTISEAMSRLDGQVSQISPLVQLHEVSVQELENLVAVTNLTLAEGAPATMAAPGAGELESWAQKVRGLLTTADELRILDQVLVSAGVKLLGAEAPVAGALELF